MHSTETVPQLLDQSALRENWSDALAWGQDPAQVAFQSLLGCFLALFQKISGGFLAIPCKFFLEVFCCISRTFLDSS